MISFKIKRPLCSLKGRVVLPGDKSIAHRSLILSAVACGKTLIENLPSNDDILSTLSSIKKLGVPVKCLHNPGQFIVQGVGLYGLKPARSDIFVGDSGTTFRLLLGLLAAQDFNSKIAAGLSLSKRPMRRVTEPLRLMGAKISSRLAACGSECEEYPPITIKGGNLTGIVYKMPVASAQVKSALLLAGLYADGSTKIIENTPTRDHTERMLRLFGANIKSAKDGITIHKANRLISPGKIYVPGDISSAAFFIVLASVMPSSKLIIENVSLNPGRIGIIRVLKRMGADIVVHSSQCSAVHSWEPIGDLIVKSSVLKGTTVTKKEIPTLIDELPVLMVAASLARGRTVLKGVGELRVKETDRIKSMCNNLRKMGAKIKIVKQNKSEGIIITGVKLLKGARVKSFGDHRTAMSMVVAGLRAKGQTEIDDVSCVSKSFPDFLKVLKTLVK